jgi:DNA-binding XRE family transcriptional regulator
MDRDISPSNEQNHLAHDEYPPQSKARTCSACSKSIVPGKTTLEWEFCGETVRVTVPADVCGCDEQIWSFHLGRAEQVVALELLTKRPDKADGRLLKHARKSMGMRRETLALALGVDAGFVSRLESEEEKPSRLYVLSMIALLRWAMEDPHWRLFGADPISLPWRGGEVRPIDLTAKADG